MEPVESYSSMLVEVKNANVSKNCICLISFFFFTDIYLFTSECTVHKQCCFFINVFFLMKQLKCLFILIDFVNLAMR